MNKKLEYLKKVSKVQKHNLGAINVLQDALDETQEFIDLQNEANRILRQVQGLSEDLNSGVLA